MSFQQLISVPDGTILERAYLSAGLRILHWMKEPTKSLGIGPNTLDDADLNTGYVKWRIWRVVARRTQALLLGLPAWENLVPRQFAQHLAAAAVLNMNDTIPSGVENRFTTNNRACLEMARSRWHVRRQKLLDLKPNIVICGGTFDMTKRLLHQTDEAYEDRGDSLVWQGIPFVRAYHPSFRCCKHVDEYEMFRRRCQLALDR